MRLELHTKQGRVRFLEGYRPGESHKNCLQAERPIPPLLPVMQTRVPASQRYSDLQLSSEAMSSPERPRSMLLKRTSFESTARCQRLRRSVLGSVLWGKITDTERILILATASLKLRGEERHGKPRFAVPTSRSLLVFLCFPSADSHLYHPNTHNKMGGAPPVQTRDLVGLEKRPMCALLLLISRIPSLTPHP